MSTIGLLYGGCIYQWLTNKGVYLQATILACFLQPSTTDSPAQLPHAAYLHMFASALCLTFASPLKASSELY